MSLAIISLGSWPATRHHLQHTDNHYDQPHPQGVQQSAPAADFGPARHRAILGQVMPKRVTAA
jgi:hypothetical protein